MTMNDHTPQMSQKLTKMGTGEPQNSIQETAGPSAASQSGQLMEMARLVNQKAISRMRLQVMRRNKVGDPEIEKQAYWLGKGKGRHKRIDLGHVQTNSKGKKILNARG